MTDSIPPELSARHRMPRREERSSARPEEKRVRANENMVRSHTPTHSAGHEGPRE